MDSLKQYMKEASHKLLTKKEEKELAKRIEQGDNEAREELINRERIRQLQAEAMRKLRHNSCGWKKWRKESGVVL